MTGTAPRAGVVPVAQVVSYYPPHLGGMEKVAEIIAAELAGTRPSTVLTTRVGAAGEPHLVRRGNLTVRRYPAFEAAHTPFAPGLLAGLLGLPRRGVVHVHVAQVLVPELVWLASRLRGWPFVAHFHLDVDPSGPLGALFVAYKKLLLGRTLRAADRVLVLSPEQAELVRGRYQVPEARIAVIPNGVEVAYFDLAAERFARLEPKAADRAEAGDTAGAAGTGVAADLAAGTSQVPEAEPTPMRLLFVGRLASQKNVPRLVEAMALVRGPVELVVAGDGEDRGAVEALVAERGLTNVRLVGGQYGADLLGWYRWADAFALPSEKEGVPLAMLEAMAAGLAVLSTDVPGSRDLLGDAGLLVAPDAAHIAAGIDALAADPAERLRLGRRAHAQVADRRWPDLVEQIAKIYADVTR
ncbi:Glycosyltransferase involved in cell wall bisynthesis [Frankia sp. AiPs1]|uniref:glycosyltransferase family 4 protein n=1 Tax=Frankia sp. AiPa1 TaxID=573492 RepID=UPI00202AD2DE|nr:glycosyltransferase [Frankia sp. AiPa1]MCL9758331.1 glycosyltransferase family 4 protein [Frankia sp. AiPa1]